MQTDGRTGPRRPGRPYAHTRHGAAPSLPPGPARPYAAAGAPAPTGAARARSRRARAGPCRGHGRAVPCVQPPCRLRCAGAGGLDATGPDAVFGGRDREARGAGPARRLWGCQRPAPLRQRGGGELGTWGGGLQGGKARGFGVTAPVATASGGRGWRGGTAMPTAAGVPPAYLPRPASRHVGRGGGGRRSRRWRVGLPLAFAAVRRTERATRTGGEMAGRDRYMRGATCPCTCLHGAAGVLWTSGGHHRRRR